MLPNPVPLASPMQSKTNRPLLRIAGRSAHDADEAQPTPAVLIPEKLGGWHMQWRETLQTMKATLVDLEQACDSAIEARGAEVAGLVDSLVQDAADAATSAAEWTQQQAQIEIDELQQASGVLRATVETLQVGVEAERDNVKRLTAELASQEAARAVAERERDELQHGCQARIAAADAQNEALRAELQVQRAELAVARHQLEAASAERSRLMTTVRLVQRALTLNTSEDIAAPVVAGDAEAVLPAEEFKLRLPPFEAAVALDAGALERSAGSDLAQGPAETPDSADAKWRALVEQHPEAVEDITRVLNQVSAMYHDEADAGRPGTEIVDRFAAVLRHARSVIVERWSTGDFDAGTLFRYQLDLLLDGQAGTSFGRHLGIAAYVLATPARRPALEESETAPDSQA